jgi:Phosphotransferase enzyme family
MERPATADAVRRLDWRFLLPDPALGRVAVVVPGDRELRAAVGDVAAAATAGTVADLARTGDGGWDLVVVGPASERVLSTAISLVAPGGWLYAELPPRAVMSGGLARATRLLDRSGFGAAQGHWHWPSIAAAKRIVAVDHPTGARAPLRQQLGRSLRGVEPAVAALVDRTGGIELLGGRASLVARRGPSARWPWLCLEPLADALRAELGDEAPSWVMLTPRFPASAHVILLLSVGAGPPVLVAKVSRTPMGRTVEREAANLRALAEADVPEQVVPRLVAIGQAGGHAVIVERALAGRPLDPASVGRDPARWIASVRTWLATMPVTGPAPAAQVGAILHEPLLRFANALPGRGGANRRLVTDTIAVCEPLRDARIPLVFEHGDLSHPNLLAADDDRLGVLDWELGRPDGLPLHDLTFFLGYAARTVGSVRRAEDLPGAFMSLLGDPATGALAALHGEASRLGIAPALIPALVTACWARTTAGLAARVAGSADELEEWLTSNRYYLLWRDALRRKDDLARALR